MNADTIARAATATLDLDDQVRRVVVNFVDDEGADVQVYAWRCGNCQSTHVQVETVRPWDREAADQKAFGHDRPGM